MKNLKKWRHQHPPPLPPLPPLPPFTRQRSAVLSSISSTEDIHLRRSKSCGEGRSCPPSDEFDLVLKKINHVRDQENEDHLVYDVNWEHVPSPRKSDACEQEFKCSALCIFLPNFSNKVKQVKPKKEQKEEQVSVLSRTVSLEKFECGSWASLPATISGEMNDSMSIYFDLPVELIRTDVNEMHSPVTAAFVFERERKGCLKKNGSRRSCDSARHVRFSNTTPASHPSSPTSFCISPRLRKAREDFNSYLEEAQRA